MLTVWRKKGTVVLVLHPKASVDERCRSQYSIFMYKSDSSRHFIAWSAGFLFGSGQISLDGNGDDGGERPDRGWVVLLNPHQPPQNILPVTGPPVDVRVLKPAGDVALRSTGRA